MRHPPAPTKGLPYVFIHCDPLIEDVANSTSCDQFQPIVRRDAHDIAVMTGSGIRALRCPSRFRRYSIGSFRYVLLDASRDRWNGRTATQRRVFPGPLDEAMT